MVYAREQMSLLWLVQQAHGINLCAAAGRILLYKKRGVPLDIRFVLWEINDVYAKGGVNKLKTPHTASIVITHYQRLLDYIIPDFVHVLADGKIVRTGGKELALELEEKGYAFLNN